jgi:hypothetical protein
MASTRTLEFTTRCYQKLSHLAFLRETLNMQMLPARSVTEKRSASPILPGKRARLFERYSFTLRQAGVACSRIKRPFTGLGTHLQRLALWL